ncbi:MAG: hypothetical protein R6V72_05890 [Cyclobacterium sp.]|uniref:hypothetical protein n=1 Tax=unclassified Cyclobacterium TaxID=2615055 RepID=UPI0013D8A9F5|nr:hypothetical protein [Cyclobacterium sp. SYSU L10401]
METKLISLVLILLIIACKEKKQDESASSGEEKKSELRSERSEVFDSSEAIWRYDFNQQTEEFEVTQLRGVDRNALTGEVLEKIINKTWPKVQIKFIRTSNDTAFISIPDSQVLTQQMGSAGAESFMVSTTYSFTELHGINHVSFDFKEGDHGIPGVYDRNSWDKNKNPLKTTVDEKATKQE